ncbi:hypothetical protein [Egicoccus halophilus]|uniref:Uncharacterized protein n=1 Tax=Egicoccus halophilus TaxID=1670830 RepID=A0A8J3ET91_9ACTN|nr:hypothetical protein [Egicoccus halophilus]GGI09044.1 hypothetical protein GCM10011354_32110 [Egicoccus halophilus]
MSHGFPESFAVANEDAKREIMATRTGAEKWVGSPFEWIMSLPSRTRGKAGEVLVEKWLTTVGLAVTRPQNSGHDRIVNGRKLEIKFSTLWDKQNTYVFQQLRDQDYEFIFLLGASPNDVHAWCPPKALAFDHAVPQHGGSKGTDTRWLTFPAVSPPDWLEPYGGSLDDCERVIKESF